MSHPTTADQNANGHGQLEDTNISIDDEATSIFPRVIVVPKQHLMPSQPIVPLTSSSFQTSPSTSRTIAMSDDSIMMPAPAAVPAASIVQSTSVVGNGGNGGGGSGGFRLQPRAGSKLNVATPSPLTNNNTAGRRSLLSGVGRSGSSDGTVQETISNQYMATSFASNERSRKRGASCMGESPSLLLQGLVVPKNKSIINGDDSTSTPNEGSEGDDTPSAQRTLFSSKDGCSAVTTPCLTASVHSKGSSVLESSPSRVQNALRSLSIKSPRVASTSSPASASITADETSFSDFSSSLYSSLIRNTHSNATTAARTPQRHVSVPKHPHSTLSMSPSPLRMKPSPTSPFEKVPPRSLAENFAHNTDMKIGNNDGRMLNPIDHMAKSRNEECDPSIHTPSSHRHLKPNERAASSSWDESASTPVPGTSHSPFIGTPQSNYQRDSLRNDGRQEDQNHLSSTPVRTPASLRTIHSPFHTPLPRTRLTPRKTPNSSYDGSTFMSPLDLQLDLTPRNNTHGNPIVQPPAEGTMNVGLARSSRSPATSVNQTTMNHSWSIPSARVEQSSFAPDAGSTSFARTHPPNLDIMQPSFKIAARNESRNGDITSLLNGKEAETDSDKKFNLDESKQDQQEPRVQIRSLLRPSPSAPRPFQGMAISTSMATTLECDGSLTDDDDDEPFVLEDPAVIAQERHDAVNPPSSNRPSQRRRMSQETETISTGQLSLQHRTTSSIGISSTQQPSMLHTSRPSATTLGSSTSLLGMALLRGDSYDDFAARQDTIDGGRKPMKDESSCFLSRLQSSGSLRSVGLDLDPPNANDYAMPSRDVHTPPAQMESPRVDSSPPLNRIKFKYLEDVEDVDHMATTTGSSSMFFSRSDPTNVQMTIEKAVLAEELLNQSPPMAICKT